MFLVSAHVRFPLKNGESWGLSTALKGLLWVPICLAVAPAGSTRQVQPAHLADSTSLQDQGGTICSVCAAE